jgi:hypothetical protein
MVDNELRFISLKVELPYFPLLYVFLPPFTSALELSGAGYCPNRRGWTHCPARARPSWIIRGACPLHDLKEV